MPGLSEREIDTQHEFSSLLDYATRNRSVGSTCTNEHSSRSHAMIQLKVTVVDKDCFMCCPTSCFVAGKCLLPPRCGACAFPCPVRPLESLRPILPCPFAFPLTHESLMHGLYPISSPHLDSKRQSMASLVGHLVMRGPVTACMRQG